MDSGFCKICGQEGIRINHHIDYEKNITIPICNKCHEKVHSKKMGSELFYPINYKKGQSVFVCIKLPIETYTKLVRYSNGNKIIEKIILEKALNYSILDFEENFAKKYPLLFPTSKKEGLHSADSIPIIPESEGLQGNKKGSCPTRESGKKQRRR